MEYIVSCCANSPPLVSSLINWWKNIQFLPEILLPESENNLMMRICYHFVMKQNVFNEELCVLQHSSLKELN